MRKYLQTRMFGGAYKKLTLEQALMGYTNDVAEKINGGNYIMGDDFSLLNVTTPIVNDQMGFQSNSSFGLYTGSNGQGEIGLLRQINDDSFANRQIQCYNSTKQLNVTMTNPDLSLTVQELRKVSNGM